MITQEELRCLLNYNPDTGIFRWRVNRGIKIKGKICGTVNRSGYRMIGINRKRYYAHRLVFLYVDGYLPENDVDHVNRDKDDNRYENLREISRQCNTRNCGNTKNNTSGVKGVCWDKKSKKWKAFIFVNYINKHLGLYDDFDNAVAARLAGEQALGWSGCDSSSPAYRYMEQAMKG